MGTNNFWDKYQNTDIKPFLKNEIFEGIIGAKEFKILKTNGLLDTSSVLISIKDPNDKPFPKELLNFKDTLEVGFYDTEDTTGSYATLTKEQAKEIALFILKHKNERFLVHCHAGMSRSAGVAKAIEFITRFDGDRYLQATSNSDINDFSDSDGNRRYFPNFVVQKRITTELMELIDKGQNQPTQGV